MADPSKALREQVGCVFQHAKVGAQRNDDRVASPLSQRHDGIERGRASGRKIARDQGQQNEQQARKYEDDRIEPGETVQQARHEVRGPDGPDRPNAQSDQGQREALPAASVRTSRVCAAQRDSAHRFQTYAAQRNTKSRVNANDGEQHREGREHGCSRGCVQECVFI